MSENNQDIESKPLYSVGMNFIAKYMDHVHGSVSKVEYLNGYWIYSLPNTLTGGTELIAEHMLIVEE